MKKLLLLLAVLSLSTGLYPQSDNDPYQYRYSLPMSFVSGLSDGLSQGLVWHYDKFQNRFPNANPGYWNPRLSYTRKYKGGIAANGPAYPGSTTYLAWTTDPYHWSRTISRMTMYGSAFIIGKNSNSFPEMALGFALHFIVWTAGFHLAYSVIIR